MKLPLLKLAACVMAAGTGVRALEQPAAPLLRGSEEPVRPVSIDAGSREHIDCEVPPPRSRAKAKDACLPLDEKHDYPYACDGGQVLCCTSGEYSSLGIGGAFGTCHKVGGGVDVQVQ